jgi:hypothetical protein
MESFAPALPETARYPRALKPNESVLSANGSPLANPWSDQSDDDNELPDAEAMERLILADSMRQGGPRTTVRNPMHGTAAVGQASRGGKSRRSFIRLRPSISHQTSSGYVASSSSQPTAASTDVHATPRAAVAPPTTYASPQELKESGALIRVPLTDGRVLEFDPFTTKPGDVDAELVQEGVSESTRVEVKEKMRSRVMELQARLMSR